MLEKHADFLRDFRGDTVHPSALELMHELGLYDEFPRLPHEEVRVLVAQVGERLVPMADFRGLGVNLPVQDAVAVAPSVRARSAAAASAGAPDRRRVRPEHVRTPDVSAVEDLAHLRGQ